VGNHGEIFILLTKNHRTAANLFPVVFLVAPPVPDFPQSIQASENTDQLFVTPYQDHPHR
jgi:hypothetical protein